MTTPVPVPDAVLSSDFPAPTDRQSGTFNTKAFNWANSARDMSVRDREIATATYTNATAAKEAADAAVPAAATAVTARNEAVTARNEAVTACNESVTARNEAVPAAAQALDAADRAEAAAASIEDGPVTSVNGKTGVVSLQVQDIPGLSDLVRLQRVQVTANTALGAAQLAKFLDCKGAITLTPAAPATLGAGWYCYLRNTGNGDITIDPDGAEQIDGQLTYTLNPGCTSMLQYDGTNFTVVELKKRTYSQRLQIESTQSFVVPADTYVIRAYAVGAGGNGGAAVASTSSGAGGSGGGMAYGDIAVTPGETLSVTIADRIAKVSLGATDLLVGNPAAHSVNATPGAVGTASKHASVTNGGAYSGGLGGAGTTGTSAAGSSGASSGSPLGSGVAGVAGAAGAGGSGWGGSGGSSGATGATGGGGGGTGGNGTSPSSIANSVGFGGAGLPEGTQVLDPLLRDCVAQQNSRAGASGTGAAGRPGQGGGGSSTAQGGNGGFGGGGGSAGQGGTAQGGNGGFGGGGAGGRSLSSSTQPAGTGGAAAVILIWD